MGLNWSRGAQALGAGLGDIIQTVGQRERDAMMHAREENLMRLNATLRQQADDRQFGQQKELIGMETTARNQAEAGRQQFETATLNTRMAHETTLANQDDKLRRDVAGAEAALTRERLTREEKMQNERYTREDMNHLERNYASQVNQIDDRLARINDEMTKQKAKAQTSGAELDPTLLQPWQQEIAQLQTQKRLLSKERDVAMAEFKNSRVKKLTPAEVEEERKLAQGGSPGGGPRRGGARDAPGVAAMSRAPGDVPSPPPKPQGMIDREQRKRRVAPEGKKEESMGSKIVRKVADELSPKAGAARREEESKRIRGVADKITGAFSGAKQDTAVQAAKVTLQGGGSVTPEKRAMLARIGKAKLKSEYGFTDRELSKLNL